GHLRARGVRALLPRADEYARAAGDLRAGDPPVRRLRQRLRRRSPRRALHHRPRALLPRLRTRSQEARGGLRAVGDPERAAARRGPRGRARRPHPPRPVSRAQAPARLRQNVRASGTREAATMRSVTTPKLFFTSGMLPKR